jgi:hypothetical protein
MSSSILQGLYNHYLNSSGVDPTMHQFIKGILYTFDLNNPDAKPAPLSYENFDDSAFVPHGIDFYIDPKTQEVSLFVVNHGVGYHSIEIFQFDHRRPRLYLPAPACAFLITREGRKH